MSSEYQQLADTLEIQRVLARVGIYTDDKRWDDHRGLFTDEVVIDFGGVQPSQTLQADALREWGKQAYRLVKTLHMFTNQDIRIESDHASVTSYGRALHERIDTGDRWDIYSRYEHVLLRVSGGWKVAGLKMEPVRENGNPNLLAEAASAMPPE